MVNGRKVSQPQRAIFAMLGKEWVLNHFVGVYCVDCADPVRKIAVEYDCQYWHQGREEEDAKKDAFLHSRGWRILHVRAKKKMVSEDMLKEGLTCLVNGADSTVILWLDWDFLG